MNHLATLLSATFRHNFPTEREVDKIETIDRHFYFVSISNSFIQEQ
jgi:hypothetical protein